MNWKKLFEPHILERGYGYYLNNAVNNLEVSEHTIRADVEGTEDYEVEISLVDGEIEEMYCSCPYAIGGWNCKHMAAVLYEWSVERGDQDNRDEEESGHIDTPEKQQIDIRKLVQDADINIIRNYLVSILSEDEKLLIRFRGFLSGAESEENIGHYINRVDDIEYNYMGRDGFIDYDKVMEIAMECKPKMIVAGASAYARTIDFKKFREIADEVGAVLMVDIAHIAGLVAAGLHPSPIPYAHVTTTTTHKTLRGPRGGMIMSSQEVADKYNFNKAIFPGIQGGPLMHVIAAKAVCFKEALSPDFKVYMKNVADNAQALCKGLKRDIKIVSGGTDNHLMLVDLTPYDLTGKAVEKLLDEAHITANKNTIPNDPKSPFVTSGIRLGTPAATSRGLNTDDMDQVAEAISIVIKEGEAGIEKARAIVKTLTDKYPLI